MKGIVCAFSGATLWGLSSVCSDYLMGAFDMPPMTLSVLRMLVAAVLFGCFAGLRFPNQARAMLKAPGQMGRLWVFGLALFLCQVTYIISISHTNAGTATVMQSLNIVLIPLVSLFLHGTKPSLGEAAGVILAFASVLSIATQGNLGTLAMPLAGLVWGLVNALSETLYVMYPTRLFARWGALAATSVAMVFGAVIALACWLVWLTVTPLAWESSLATMACLTPLGWLALAGVCVIGTFAAFALFLKGVSLVGPLKGALLGAMEPVSSAALCAVLLGYAFTGWDWLGLVLMVFTIFLVTLVPKKKRPQE